MGKLHYETATKTMTDIVNLFENGQLNLSPAFQGIRYGKRGIEQS